MNQQSTAAVYENDAISIFCRTCKIYIRFPFVGGICPIGHANLICPKCYFVIRIAQMYDAKQLGPASPVAVPAGIF